MKIAIPFKDESIFKHFGHTETFLVYDVEGEIIPKPYSLATNGIAHRAITNFLADNGIDAVICGEIGHGAKDALESFGIKAYPGVSLSPDEAVSQLLNGTLEFDLNANCDNHESHSHNNQSKGGCGNHGSSKQAKGGCANHGSSNQGKGGCGSHGSSNQAKGGCGSHGSSNQAKGGCCSSESTKSHCCSSSSKTSCCGH